MCFCYNLNIISFIVILDCFVAEFVDLLDPATLIALSISLSGKCSNQINVHTVSFVRNPNIAKLFLNLNCSHGVLFQLASAS